MHWSGQSQSFACVELAQQIDTEEQRVGHRRTVVVGDFNMNPFENGMVAAGALHAVSSRRVASRVTRTVQKREYQFFYNPMWGHFGDIASETAGSYYYSRAEHVNYFWNVFDQVLIRPSLAEAFNPSSLAIVRTAGARSLIGIDGKPDSVQFSDHLPIRFDVDF
jgi:hypothetical protein